MVYVALSRVRTLSGVHLTCFNPKSLMVSSCSIKEINRLRQLYRPDLPQYAIPTDCGSRKRTLTGTIDESQAKNQKNMPPPKVARDKRSRPSDSSYIQQNFIRSAIIRHMPTMENRLRSWLTPYN
uniref:Uncharacterized protein n=1 Tax=Amphimedon queenslandica TaxID=400682 RepID=A0A1X7V5S6_AMPQE